jgi:HAD superfamily hydrolase (TIGR01549 family)
MNSQADVARVLGQTSVLLLDFDGPICKVFATTHDYVVAQRLRQVLADSGAVLPTDIEATRDPLEVLRFAATLPDQTLVARVESELNRLELEAVAGAQATPHVKEVVQAAALSGMRIGIVSNNSPDAIELYVAQQNWAKHIAVVVGRSHSEPHLMKPHPRPVGLAYIYLDVPPHRCALVGDSVSDIAAARAAHVKSIGLANRPEKLGLLGTAGADAVIASMSELLIAIRERAHPDGSAGPTTPG